MWLECSFCFSRSCSSLGCNQFNYGVFHSDCAQAHLTLFDPMDCILPGSSVHGIFPVRILGWVAVCFSRGTWASCVSCIGRKSFYHCTIPLYHLGSLNFLATPHGMWDLNSQTRDWTGTCCTGGAVLTTGPLGKSPNYGITPLIRVPNYGITPLITLIRVISVVQ